MALISQSTAVAMIVATLTLTPVVARAQPNQEAIKQTLTAAQASLAEMTKLPAAATLQGDVRTAVSGFIDEFNAFASLPKDWKAKYQVASASLDKMLAAAAAAPAPAAAPAAPALRRTGRLECTRQVGSHRRRDAQEGPHAARRIREGHG